MFLQMVAEGRVHHGSGDTDSSGDEAEESKGGEQEGKYAEEGKVAIRNVRRDAMKVAQRCEKDGLISKDRLKEAEDEVQKITDGSIKKLEDAAAAKDKDVMTL